MISYEKLWEVMREKGITQYALIKTYHISAGQLTRLRNNENVSTHTIATFCRILHCQPGDIMSYVFETSELKNKPEQL